MNSSSNNGNWQWAQEQGCDAAPYFRVSTPFRNKKNLTRLQIL